MNPNANQKPGLSSDDLRALKAHQTGDVKYLLSKWFCFRAYVLFNNRKKFHAYGNEHAVTYNQLRYGRIQEIRLQREKGYTDLIHLLEKTWRGKYTSARIYMREPGEKDFNTVCREYNEKAELIDCQDPVTMPADITLWYHFLDGNVVISDRDPATLPDFKSIINDKLK